MSLMKDDPSFKAGRAMREQLFGATGVARLDTCDDFVAPFENYVTRILFGETWTRPGLTIRERALMTLAIAAALGRDIPLRRQVKCAIENGATKEDIQEVLLHTTMYIGIAGGVESWASAVEVLKEIGAYD